MPKLVSMQGEGLHIRKLVSLPGECVPTLVSLQGDGFPKLVPLQGEGLRTLVPLQGEGVPKFHPLLPGFSYPCDSSKPYDLISLPQRAYWF